MNSRSLKITISNPCSQDWDEMKASEVGRFCSSCSKNVIDFSRQSDAEIKQYVKKHASEEICGRFYKHQVERIRIEFDGQILQSDVRFWQKFLVVLLVCFGSDAMGIDFCIAQTEVQDTTAVIANDTIVVQEDTLVELVEVDTVVKHTPKKKPEIETIAFLTGDVFIYGNMIPITQCGIDHENDKIALFENQYPDTQMVKNLGINLNTQAKTPENQEEDKNQDLRKLVVLTPFVKRRKRRK